MIKNKRQKADINNSKHGFTLVETLVAIAILLVSVVGPLSIVAGSVATANLAKDQVLVYYLAQEEIELIKNKRDSNILENRNWLDGLNTCVTGCTIEASDLSVQPCLDIEDVCAAIYKNDSGNVKIFSHTGPLENKTSFKRITNIEVSGTNNNEYDIEVTIKWSTGSLYGSGSIDKTFTIHSRIFNWSS